MGTLPACTLTARPRNDTIEFTTAFVRLQTGSLLLCQTRYKPIGDTTPPPATDRTRSREMPADKGSYYKITDGLPCYPGAD